MAESQNGGPHGGNDILLPADVHDGGGIVTFAVDIQVAGAADSGAAGAAALAPLIHSAGGDLASPELVDLRGEIANTHVVALGGTSIPSSAVGGDSAPHPTLPLEGGGQGGGDEGGIVALDPDSVLQQAGGEVLTLTGDPGHTVALQGTWHLDYQGGGDGFSMYTGVTSDALHPTVTLFVHTALQIDDNAAVLI